MASKLWVRALHVTPLLRKVGDPLTPRIAATGYGYGQNFAIEASLANGFECLSTLLA